MRNDPKKCQGSNAPAYFPPLSEMKRERFYSVDSYYVHVLDFIGHELSKLRLCQRNNEAFSPSKYLGCHYKSVANFIKQNLKVFKFSQTCIKKFLKL